MRGRDHTTASMKPGSPQKRKWKPTEWNVRDLMIPWPLFLDNSHSENHSNTQDSFSYLFVDTCLSSMCLISARNSRELFFAPKKLVWKLLSTEISSKQSNYYNFIYMCVCIHIQSHIYTHIYIKLYVYIKYMHLLCKFFIEKIWYYLEF